MHNFADQCEPLNGVAGYGPPSEQIEMIPVHLIRPEQGLGRKRSKAGHDDLCESIRQFGVLTPVTVRIDPADPGRFLLIKGQGRTLACRRIGLDAIPAFVVDSQFSEEQKTQQFLVENVARLRMTPVERALIIAHARKPGEETADLALRFGVTATTVRRLEAQLGDIPPTELRALRSGLIALNVHAVIAEFGSDADRPALVDLMKARPSNATALRAILEGLGWHKLSGLGAEHQRERLSLLQRALEIFDGLPRRMSAQARLQILAQELLKSLPIGSSEGHSCRP